MISVLSREEVLRRAEAIRVERYAEAKVVFASGSLLRGEGTPSSDLDLVVVYTVLPNALRESFTCDGLPVEGSSGVSRRTRCTGVAAVINRANEV